MKPEHIKLLLEDFPDLLGPSTAISHDMPDAWLPTLRVLLTHLRAIKYGRRPGTVACDIAVRVIGTRVKTYPTRPQHDELDVALTVVGQSRTAVRSEVRNAIAGCRIADLTRLRDVHALDILDGAVTYVRSTIRAGHQVDAKDVVVTSSYEPDEVRYFMPLWALEAVSGWIKGEQLGDLTESEKARYLKISKSEE
ncbi:hypothetical protein IFT59_07295 [Rhizobium sp. CFBP 8752]|uniref:hypothetical protein n=1 Tax=Rhizobium sp. CFBP 8752 TaxID=2775301 RepID=UPI0017852067|nr:hypothetical protein [Rhizobium sp. CFBP 8752]MBD8663057.1 hypothetical protein [Rhizobium sp. CFBP 8752]